MRIKLVLITIMMVSVGGVEKFCDPKRKLLLAGVFNYKNILFAYSWKDVNDFQQQIVWRFQITDKKLVEMGKSLTVEQVFPGIPLFRAGFGLSLTCGSSDTKCNLYNKLVFVFFQTFYKVFRFNDDRFADEPKGNIPWGLETRGEAKEFGFGHNNFDNVYAAAFMPGSEPQLFIVSNNILYSSSVDIRAPSLKWLQLTQSQIFSTVLGAFVSGEKLILNRNESPDDMISIYDRNGRETKNTTVSIYFGCTAIAGAFQNSSDSKLNTRRKNGSKHGLVNEEINNRYAAIIITGLIIAIIIINTSAALFWLIINRFQTKKSINIF